MKIRIFESAFDKTGTTNEALLGELARTAAHTCELRAGQAGVRVLDRQSGIPGRSDDQPEGMDRQDEAALVRRGESAGLLF